MINLELIKNKVYDNYILHQPRRLKQKDTQSTMIHLYRKLCWSIVFFCFTTSHAAPILSSADYPSIQDAINAHPGQKIYVPAGTHKIEGAIHLVKDGSGLYGPGRIEQTAPGSSIITIENASDISIEGLTLTRHEPPEWVRAPGIYIGNAERVTVRNVQVTDNHARDASIDIRKSKMVTIKDCTVRNYKCIAIDDRTDSELYGYAFRAIDGTGILVSESTGTIIESNRILEDRLLPTREAKELHKLGQLTQRPEKRRKLMSTSAWEDNYVSNWHQGSAIVVTSPRATHHTIIRGNYLQNCAQGIDIHSDKVICSDNIVDHGMMGIKMTHGSQNIIVKGNLLTHIDLWGILINPGAASEHAKAATESKSAKPSNHDSGIIISGNQITEYGYGHEYWNWGGMHKDGGSSFAIALLGKQLEENPEISDVLIQGNIVYNSARNSLDDPIARYRFAVYIEGTPDSRHFPKNLQIKDNILHPGKDGVSNHALETLSK